MSLVENNRSRVSYYSEPTRENKFGEGNYADFSGSITEHQYDHGHDDYQLKHNMCPRPSE